MAAMAKLVRQTQEYLFRCHNGICSVLAQGRHVVLQLYECSHASQSAYAGTEVGLATALQLLA